MSEILDLNTATARGIVVLYAKYNDRYIPVKVLPDGSLVSSVTLNASDIQIGSFEIKDAETNTRANIDLDLTKNALYVKSESLAQENTLQVIGANLEEIRNNLILIKNKIFEGNLFKEYIWEPEQINITQTNFSLIRSFNCRLVKSKAFYISNIGNDTVWVSLYMSIDDMNNIPLIENQYLQSNNYLVYNDDKVFISLKVFARSQSGQGLLLISGYGLGG
ncbi:MAG: hypothetical protein QXM07_09595 [Nitrososphaerota archaeon]